MVSSLKPDRVIFICQDLNDTKKKFSHAISLYKVFYNKIVLLVFVQTACHASQGIKTGMKKIRTDTRKICQMVFTNMWTKFHDNSIGSSCLYSEGSYSIQLQVDGALIYKQ